MFTKLHVYSGPEHKNQAQQPEVYDPRKAVEEMTGRNCMTIYSGIQFDPLHPKAEDVLTEDIAHALSLLTRANGHYKYFYSVAQHSINCAKEAQLRGYSERIQFACLLHDASEAYMSDVTRPIKRQLKEFIKIEENLQDFILSVYDLADLTEEERRLINKVDDDILQYEMTFLFKSSLRNEPSNVLIDKKHFEFTVMETIKDEFIEWVHAYQKLLSNQLQ